MRVYKCISHALHCLAGFLFLYSFQHPLATSDVFRSLDSPYYVRMFWNGRLICFFPNESRYLHCRRSHACGKNVFCKKIAYQSGNVFSTEKENLFHIKRRRDEIKIKILLSSILQRTCLSLLSL